MSSASKKRRKRPSRRSSDAAQRPVAAPARAQPAPRPRPQIEDERPPAPWGSFPLVELVVLVALVMLGIGFFSSGSRGTTLLVTGLALGSLAGLELSVREHFGGYRSHTILLAGAAAVITMLVLLYAADIGPPLALIGGGAVFGVCCWLLLRAFRRRAGRLVKLR